MLANLTKEQAQQVLDAMVNFVIRVSAGENASEGEATALPNVVKVLLDYYTVTAWRS